MNFKRLSFLLCIILIFNLVNAQKAYKIEVKINNLPDQNILLGYHFGDKQYVLDTAKTNSKGLAEFSDNEPLKQGMYFIVLPKNNYFDILVDSDQFFSIENDTSDFINNMKIKGSEENIIFYEYQKFINIEMQKAGEIRAKIGTFADGSDSIEIYKQAIEKIAATVEAEYTKIITQNSNGLFAAILKTSKQINVPDAPVDENGNVIDSMFQYNYYRVHYFDNVDFQDSRILRTPVFGPKLIRYISEVIIQIPDTVIPECEKLIRKTEGNQEMFQFVLSALFNHYNQSKIMGIEKVFVYLAENYYLNGKADWADTTFLRELTERVVKIRPNILGNKAPELKLETTHQGEFISMHQIEAEFTILFFWEPNCGHCKKTAPELYEYYSKVRDKGVEILAIYTQINKEEWTDYIEEKGYDWINVWDPYNFSNFRDTYDIYSTPVIYVLDKEKKIIAKRISVEQAEDIIANQMKK